jgi:archaellum component FlaC
MNCPDCGAKLSDNTTTCIKCGRPLASVNDEIDRLSKQNQELQLIIERLRTEVKQLRETLKTIAKKAKAVL